MVTPQTIVNPFGKLFGIPLQVIEPIDAACRCDALRSLGLPVGEIPPGNHFVPIDSGADQLGAETDPFQAIITVGLFTDPFGQPATGENPGCREDQPETVT